MLAEALECLGGGGYIEESCMPRLYREAPVNSVWEGPGNVICLDVLRALSKEPDRSRRSLPSCRGGVLRCPAAVARIDLRVMVWAKSWVDHLLERVG